MTNIESSQQPKSNWLKRKYERIPVEYRKAFWLALYSFGALVVIIFLLIIFLKLVSPSIYISIEHFIERNELVWVGAMGMLGIFFAVRAMYEASSALNESRKIYNTISSFFDNYEKVTDRIRLLIQEAKEELWLLVSLPAYGLIVDDKLGDIFNNEVCKRFPDAKTKGLNIKLICFDQDLCTKYEAKMKEMDKDNKKFLKYMNYKKEILEGIFGVRNYKRQSDSFYQNIWTTSMDSHIRLFIADDSKAIFATVPDFNPDNPTETSIAGFETSQKEMIRVLKRLFDEQSKSSNPLSKSEYTTFKFD